MMEVEFRVTRRVAEEASTPAYQALMTVRRRPKARIAIVIPKRVRLVRSLLRKAFFHRILRMSIVQQTLLKMLELTGPGSSPRVVSDHDDGLSQFRVEAPHQVQNFFR